MFDFLGIGKTLRDFAGELQSIRVEIEKLRRQMEDIEYAPLCKADVLRALEVWATDRAKQYQSHFESFITAIRTQPKIVGDKVAVWRIMNSREVLPDPSAGLPLSRDTQLCGLLGVAGFVSLMKARLDQMDCSPEGLPMAEREAAIAPLLVRMNRLEAREAELVAGAEKAGLSVS